MSDIHFKCPECHNPLAIDEAGAGLQVNCPHCASSITVPPKRAAAFGFRTLIAIAATIIIVALGAAAFHLLVGQRRPIAQRPTPAPAADVAAARATQETPNNSSSRATGDPAIIGTWLVEFGSINTVQLLRPIGADFLPETSMVISTTNIITRFKKPETPGLFQVTDPRGNPLRVVKDGANEFFLSECTYTVNTNTTPREIDVTIVDAMDMSKCGVYKIDEGALWLSLDSVNPKNRPKHFTRADFPSTFQSLVKAVKAPQPPPSHAAALPPPHDGETTRAPAVPPQPDWTVSYDAFRATFSEDVKQAREKNADLINTLDPIYAGKEIDWKLPYKGLRGSGETTACIFEAPLGDFHPTSAANIAAWERIPRGATVRLRGKTTGIITSWADTSKGSLQSANLQIQNVRPDAEDLYHKSGPVAKQAAASMQPQDLLSSSSTKTSGFHDPHPESLLKLLSLFGAIQSVSTDLVKNNQTDNALMQQLFEPTSKLAMIYREELGITMPPTRHNLPADTATRLPKVAAAIDALSPRPAKIEAFPSKSLSFERVKSILGAQFQKHTEERLPGSVMNSTCTWYRYGRWSFGGLSDVTVIRIYFADSPGSQAVAGSPRATTAPPPASMSNNWPTYFSELNGGMEVRVRNPNEFQVKVGLRSATKGKDFTVPAQGTQSVHVPNGRYDIFFQYSTDPDALYQGDSFTLNGNGVEIQIVKAVNGNYGIRKVK